MKKIVSDQLKWKVRTFVFRYFYFLFPPAVMEWILFKRPTPPPPDLKALTLEAEQKKKRYQYFVETGTFWGHTLLHLAKNNHALNFKKLYTIELARHFHARSKWVFRDFPFVETYQGDSAHVLPKIMPQLDGPTLFWLDGHYCSGITAKGAKECPIYEELHAIFSAPQQQHLILIDDAVLFTGNGDYPPLEALKSYILKHRPKASMEVKDDIIFVAL